jgi:sulfonate transport system substrate-binding protein
MMRALIAVIFLGLTALAPGLGSAETVIRYASLTSINKAPAALAAQSKGFFEKHGVKVEMKLFPSGKTAIEAMAAGQFDIGMFGDIPGLALLQQGYPGKIVAAGLGGPARQVLAVPVGSNYQSLKDLKGKRIGLTKNSTDEIALESTMRKQGLQWSDFQVINLQPSEKATALKTGAVDALEAWEPVPSIIVVNGIGRRLLSADGDIPDIVGVTIASEKVLKENADAVVRFLRALHEGAVYAQNHPDEMVDLLAKQLSVNREVLIQAIPTQWWYIEVFGDTLGNWQHSADFMHRIKRVSQPFDVRALIDTSYLAKALGKTYPLKEPASQAIKYPVVTVKH